MAREDNYELAILLYCTLSSELEHENEHFPYELKVHKEYNKAITKILNQ